MGSIEMGLEWKLLVRKTAGGFLREASAIDDVETRAVRLEEDVQTLEEERRKIEAFKRELPHSVLIISDVIETLREELERCRSERYAVGRRVLEEFMPIKSKFEEEGGVKMEKDAKDKMNWMSSAQLWSDNYCEDANEKSNNGRKKTDERAEDDDRRQENENLSKECKSRTGGGAFLPFKAVSAAKKEEKVTPVLPDLSLLSPGMKNSRLEEHPYECFSSKSGGPAPASSTAGTNLSLQGQQQQPRKARRCWSPELHRRFVAALQQLGGAQVATPKQIRELMKVDGLTNDEVKSHLQKYRLHTRRMPNSPSASKQPVGMVGNLWVPPQALYLDSSQQSASQSGSPQSPLQLGSTCRAISVTAGDSYEEEDGKSESYSWK